MRHVIALLVALTVGRSARAVAQDPKAAVLAAGQAVFDAMAKRDTAALRRLVHPAGHLFATFERDGQPEARVSSANDFVTQIGSYPTVPLERMWDAEVRVSGTVATIWTQYDFHNNGVFSHCGIDSFQFVRGPDRWLLTSIIYTVVRDPCPKNPNGPPR
jgi:hypothetical protein